MNPKRYSAVHLSVLVLLIAAAGIASGCGSSTTPVSSNPPPTPITQKNIYVTQTTGVLVFPIAATGNVAPTTTITNATTAFGDAHRTAFDSNGKIYVTDAGISSVVIFAASATGAATPTATIAGTGTGLDQPSGIALDSHNNIYVANSNGFTA